MSGINVRQIKRQQTPSVRRENADRLWNRRPPAKFRN